VTTTGSRHRSTSAGTSFLGEGVPLFWMFVVGASLAMWVTFYLV